MTVADPKNVFSKEPTAKQGAARRGVRDGLGGEGRRKVDADIADLIIMSSLDDKAPAEMAGSGALLDTLVAAHLEGAGVLETELPSAVEEAAPSNDGHMELLQREIELLLRGDAPAEAGAEGSSEAEALLEVPVEAVGDVAEVTQGEIDALLPPVAEGAVGEAEGVGAVVEEERGLTEAEGVLAEELAQLMADSQVKVDGKEAEGAAVVEAEVLVAEGSGAAPVEGAVAGDIGAAGEGEFEAPPVVVELPEEAAEEVAVVRPGVVSRMRGVMGNVALLLAQVFDMPFGWIGAAEKNILGVVAFMLLVSGVVLYVMAWVYR